MNSSITFGCVFGCFLGGYLADVYGRRYAVVVGEIIVITGAFGHLIGNIALLLLFRFVLGFGLGICSLMKPMYIAELSNKSNRGAILVVFSVASSLGMNFAFWLKATTGTSGVDSTPWRWLVLVGVVPALALVLLTVYVLPESPEWLKLTGKLGTSSSSDIENDSEKEKEALLKDAPGDNAQSKQGGKVTPPFLQISQMTSLALKDNHFFKPLLLACLIGICNVFGGGTITMFELDHVIPSVFFNPTYPSNVVYVGIVHLVGVCAGIPLIDSLGRRPLLFVGLFGIGVVSFVLGVLISISPTTPSSSFTSILFLLYMLLYQIGPQA
jgi:MFS family permease